jgi:hypothetical protein
VPKEVAADPDAFIEIGEEYHDELEVIRIRDFASTYPTAPLASDPESDPDVRRPS